MIVIHRHTLVVVSSHLMAVRRTTLLLAIFDSIKVTGGGLVCETGKCRYIFIIRIKVEGVRMHPVLEQQLMQSRKLRGTGQPLIATASGIVLVIAI